MTTKLLLKCYFVIAGGIFGWAFGVLLFLLLTAIIGNLLALSSTGQEIIKALMPLVSFLSMAFPIASIIAGIIISLKRGRKINLKASK